MAVDAKVGSFNHSLVDGSIAYTGVGFQPDALLVFGSSLTSAGAGAHMHLRMSAVAGGVERATAFYDFDNATIMQPDWAHATATVCDEVSVEVAGFSSFDSDGFTLNWSVTSPTADLLSYVALGAVSAKVVQFQSPASPGTVAVTGVGFVPTAIIFYGAASATGHPVNPSGGDIKPLVGFTSGVGEDRAITNYVQHGPSTSDTDRAFSESACILRSNGSSIHVEATLDSFDADGFTLDFSASNVQNYFFALCIGGTPAHVGTITQPTSTGAQSITGVGFTPGVVLVASTCDTTTGNRDHARFMFGAGTATDQTCVWGGSSDNVGTSVCDQAHSLTNLIEMYTEGTPTLNAAAELTAMTSDGFDLDWTTADATQRKIVYLALEGEAAPSTSARLAAVGDSHSFAKDSHDGVQFGVGNSIDGDCDFTAGEGANVEADQTTFFNQTSTPATETDDNTFRVDAVKIKLNGPIEFKDDVRQTFNPGTNNAGINVGSLAGDPGSPSNGDVWYDSSANELTARINGANVALGAAGAAGDLDDLTDVVITSPSTDEVLKYNGSNWVNGSSPGGALVFREAHTASTSATLDFTTWYSASYDAYAIELQNVIPATNAVDLYMRVSTNGGSSYDSGNNYAISIFAWTNAASATAGEAPGSPVGQWVARKVTEISSNSNYGVCGRIVLYSPGSTSHYKRIDARLGYLTNSSAQASVESRGTYLSTTAVNAFRFLFSSGNIASGTIRVYGISNS